MNKIIGIRREDKNQWEKRAPLIPEDVKILLGKNDLDVIVQPSDIRVFQDEEYERAGAKIDESLSSANVVFAVKEIPLEILEAKKTQKDSIEKAIYVEYLNNALNEVDDQMIQLKNSKEDAVKRKLKRLAN